MRVTSQYGKLDVDSRGFVTCPRCRNPRFARVRRDTSADNFPAYCSRCKTEILLHIECKTRAFNARVQD
nr:MAG TPA: cysteine-rich protein [Caudoviricetes sp.]